jgi:putative SOS response-associated peptidase YedK
MCSNVKSLLESQLKRARKSGMNEDADALQQELFTLGKGNYHQVSGFSYPELIIYNNSDNRPLRSVWGLVPQTVKDNDPADFRKRSNTLNAGGETIFNSPAFRDSDESKHCLVYIDGYYDHHYYAGGKYPFFI